MQIIFLSIAAGIMSWSFVIFSADARIELCRFIFLLHHHWFWILKFFFFFSTSAGTEIHRQSSSPLLLLEWNCVDSSLLLCSLLELNCVIHGCIWIPSLLSKCLLSKPVHYYLEKNACGLSLMLLNMWQPLSVLLCVVGSSLILC